MRIGSGVEWAVHCCTILAVVPAGRAISAQRLAEFHGVPQPYLAKHLQALVRSGLVESVPGPRGGYRLARAAEDISLLDVVLAVDGDEPAFTCSEIRQRGPAAQPPAAYRGACGIAAAMWAAERAWRDALAAVTIAALNEGVLRDAPPAQLAGSATWLRDALTPTNRPRRSHP